MIAIVLQAANPDFYIKMLPLFDGGNDVGMVLSPQCFHNLRLHADVFNHANIHFWEYAQHGYDALGFISCTGISLGGLLGLGVMLIARHACTGRMDAQLQSRRC